MVIDDKQKTFVTLFHLFECNASSDNRKCIENAKYFQPKNIYIFFFVINRSAIAYPKMPI